MLPQKDFSQHGEQKIIHDFFSNNPPRYKFFVDVGALDLVFSNTAPLAFSGWSGLLLEPNPIYADCLKRQLKGTNTEVLNCAAGDAPGTAPLYLHTGFGHDSLLKEWYPQDRTNRTVQVQILTLPFILEQKKVPMDFDLLSVDCEGFDNRIITHLFQKSHYRPSLIVTERTSYAGNQNLFTKNNYTLIAQTGPPDYGNFIFSKQ